MFLGTRNHEKRIIMQRNDIIKFLVLDGGSKVFDRLCCKASFQTKSILKAPMSN